MLGRHHFQSDLAIFVRIFGDEDTAHPAESQQLANPISIDHEATISPLQKSLGLKRSQQLFFDHTPSRFFGRR